MVAPRTDVIILSSLCRQTVLALFSCLNLRLDAGCDRAGADGRSGRAGLGRGRIAGSRGPRVIRRPIRGITGRRGRWVELVIRLLSLRLHWRAITRGWQRMRRGRGVRVIGNHSLRRPLSGYWGARSTRWLISARRRRPSWKHGAGVHAWRCRKGKTKGIRISRRQSVGGRIVRVLQHSHVGVGKARRNYGVRGTATVGG